MFEGSGPAGALARRMGTLARIDRAMAEALGKEAAAHVHATELSDEGELTLLADSPAWASLARFKVPDVLAAIAAEFPGARRAKVLITRDPPPRA